MTLSSSPPRITVIVPSLDQDFYLERALCSVLDQGYGNLELIVMDGGSMDSSADIIRAYAGQIDHWQSVWDSGPAEAVNTALTWATGQIVGVLDADDAYLPHALAEAARAFTAEVDWAVGHAFAVDELDERTDDLPARPADNLQSFLLDPAGPLPGSTVFYRAELLRAMGGFDTELKLAYGHEMQARLYAAKRKPGLIAAPVAAVREHELSLTATQGLTCGHEFIEAAERYAVHLPPTSRYLLWRACDESRRVYTEADLQIGDDPAARTLWQQLLKNPGWLADADYRRKLLQRTAAHAAPHSLGHDDTRHAA
jgi:glycosyltransferase involved in cell wall biosynthesis